jgi:PKD repeat protein
VNGEITSWAYDFGDGNVATVDASAADYAAGDENVSHTYAAAGTYTVTLTVTDSAGKTDTATTEVVAEEAAV